MVQKSIKIVHINTGLSTGGSEMMLFKLLSNMDRNKFNSVVISLKNIGEVGEKIADLGIPVFALNMSSKITNPFYFLKLIWLLRKQNPDIVQTWFYHADLLAGVAAKIIKNQHVIWNIRHGNLDSKTNKLHVRLTAKLCAKLSHRIPERILCNSNNAALVHQKLGYPKEKFHIIGNGFDLNLFKPDNEARLSIRKELGIEEKTLLIGLIARFDPLKNHKGFLKAAKILQQKQPNIHFVLCGQKIDYSNNILQNWITENNLTPYVHLLGNRDDIPRITAALDIATSSSFGEGFCNAIGEAMACCVPCVVTDVGDSAWIVGKTGVTIPADDPVALAEAWQKLLSLPYNERIALGLLARKRVSSYFSLGSVVKQYEQFYEQLLIK